MPRSREYFTAVSTVGRDLEMRVLATAVRTRAVAPRARRPAEGSAAAGFLCGVILSCDMYAFPFDHHTPATRQRRVLSFEFCEM